MRGEGAASWKGERRKVAPEFFGPKDEELIKKGEKRFRDRWLTEKCWLQSNN